MDIFVLVLLFYLSVIGHEFAHLNSMLNKGAKVHEFGIGAPKGFRVSYVLKTGKYADIRFSLYLFTWFLGAFVDGDFEHLPYKDRALIVCAGPFANIQFGCLLLIIVFVSSIFQNFDKTLSFGMEDWILYLWYFISSTPFLWGALLTVPICWYGRKIISAYLAPVLGILLLIWVFKSVSYVGVANYFSEVMGPIGLIETLTENSCDLSSSVLLAGQLSLVLGASNLLPIYPLDGGYLFLPAIRDFSPNVAKYYKKAGLWLIMSIMALVFAKDIIMLCGYYWFFAISLAIAGYYLWKKVIKK
jgi:membrane-associated protease RseP (regulator of RpoE activity)